MLVLPVEYNTLLKADFSHKFVNKIINALS